uniref:pseudouridine synthase n=1 Tax=Cyanobium sp. TaxID=2164130 RepID=UPI004048BB5C
EVDGQHLAQRPQPLVLLLNKPPEVLCSCQDPEGRPTVLDLLPAELAQGQGLHPVGRLDFESRGALLISNQGDLTLKLTHPRYSHRKTYRVWLRGRPSPDQIKRWAEGLWGFLAAIGFRPDLAEECEAAGQAQARCSKAKGHPLTPRGHWLFGGCGALGHGV